MNRYKPTVAMIVISFLCVSSEGVGDDGLQFQNHRDSKCTIALRIFDGTIRVSTEYIIDSVDKNKLNLYEQRENVLGEQVQYLIGGLGYGKFDDSIIPPGATRIEENYRDLGFHVIEMDLTYYDGSYMAGIVIHDEKQFIRLVGKNAENWPSIIATYTKWR